MNKYSVIAIVLLFIANYASAMEKVSTVVDIRNDFIYPEKGDKQTVQNINVYRQYKQIGGFLESSYKNKNHTLTIKPSTIYKKEAMVLFGRCVHK